MDVVVIAFVLGVFTLLVVSNAIAEKLISSYLRDKTKNLNFFVGSRDKNIYARSIQTTDDNIQVVDCCKTVHTEKAASFKKFIEELKSNESKDSEAFKSILLDALNEKDGYVNISIKQDQKVMYFFNNKIAPSHIFFLKENIALNEKEFRNDIIKIYDLIIDNPKTDIDTIRSIATLVYSNALSSVFIIIFHNAIIGYVKNSPFFCIYIDRLDVFKALENLKLVKFFEMYKNFTFYLMLYDNILNGKAIKNNNEIRMYVEIDREAFGFENFLNFTYGKKSMSDFKNNIEAFEDETCIMKLNIPGNENIYEKFQYALNHKKNNFRANVFL
ncbi:hypothetical protein COBT_001926 [Conglomerata obtusa]